MARIRTVKPEFWQDSRMVRLPALERLVFLCTISMADDEGRLEGDAHTIWKFGGFQEPVAEIAGALQTLGNLGRLRFYTHQGNPYVEIANFTKHQKINRPSPSKHPAYSNGCDLLGEDSVSVHGGLTGGSGIRYQVSGIRDQVSGIRDQGSGRTAKSKSFRGASRPDSDEAWTAYTAAYLKRYRTEPTRNAEQNAAMARFCKLVPLAEAPAIAAFYVAHDKAWYVQHQHAVKYLAKDASGLRTQWLAGERVTETRARQQDKTGARADVYGPLIEEARRKESNDG